MKQSSFLVRVFMMEWLRVVKIWTIERSRMLRPKDKNCRREKQGQEINYSLFLICLFWTFSISVPLQKVKNDWKSKDTQSLPKNAFSKIEITQIIQLLFFWNTSKISGLSLYDKHFFVFDNWICNVYQRLL